MVTTIKFGTDGWRGVIAEDHTFDNVRRSAQGFASYLTETRQTVIVSHYKRFATEVLAATGFKIRLTQEATRMPVISYTFVDKKSCRCDQHYRLSQPVLRQRLQGAR